MPSAPSRSHAQGMSTPTGDPPPATVATHALQLARSRVNHPPRILLSTHIQTFPERQRLLMIKNLDNGFANGNLHGLPTGEQASIKLVDDSGRNTERKIDDHLIRMDDTAAQWFRTQATENVYHTILTTGRLPVPVEELEQNGIDIERAEQAYMEFKRSSTNRSGGNQNGARNKGKTKPGTSRSNQKNAAQTEDTTDSETDES